MEWILPGAVLPVLIYSTVLDLKKREIPILLYLCFLFPLGITAQVFGFGPPLVEALVSGMVWGMLYLVLALFFGGGGGDVIMMAVLGFCLGKAVIIIVAVATILLTGYRLYFGFVRRETKRIVPYAPFALSGFMAQQAISLILK